MEQASRDAARVWFVTGASSGFGRAITAHATAAGDVVIAAARHPETLVRAVLPGMRRRRRGAIVQVSSVGGQVTQPGFSSYCAAEFAVEGYSAALASEVAPFGIDVLVVEPGAFRTAFSGDRLAESPQLPAYEEIVGPTRRMIKGIDGLQPGDPGKAAAIFTALADDSPPLRLPLGGDAVDGIRAHLDQVTEELTAWEPLARSTAVA